MTATDRGHIEEIITHLQKVEQDYKINLSSEKEWLRGLDKSPVWHDTSIYPEYDKWILVKTSDDKFEAFIHTNKTYWQDIREWTYIDDLQKLSKVERNGKDCIVFKSIPMLLDSLEPTDRVKWYTNKLADALEKEGYSTDAKIVRESIKVMNGEKVAMATMDEKPETSLWHDANILPANPDEIVIEHNEYGTSIVPASKMSRPKGSKWAYIKDILKL